MTTIRHLSCRDMTIIDTTISRPHQYLRRHSLITTTRSSPSWHRIATCRRHCTIKMINMAHGRVFNVMITIGPMAHSVTYQILLAKVDILFKGKKKDITKITISMLDQTKTFINSPPISTCHCPAAGPGLREMMAQRGRWKTWTEILELKWTSMIVMMKGMEGAGLLKGIQNKGRQGLDRARIYLSWKGLKLLRFMDLSSIDRVWSVFEYFFYLF